MVYLFVYSDWRVPIANYRDTAALGPLCTILSVGSMVEDVDTQDAIDVVPFLLHRRKHCLACHHRVSRGFCVLPHVTI